MTSLLRDPNASIIRAESFCQVDAIQTFNAANESSLRIESPILNKILVDDCGMLSMRANCCCGAISLMKNTSCFES